MYERKPKWTKTHLKKIVTFFKGGVPMDYSYCGRPIRFREARAKITEDFNLVDCTACRKMYEHDLSILAKGTLLMGKG